MILVVGKQSKKGLHPWRVGSLICQMCEVLGEQSYFWHLEVEPRWRPGRELQTWENINSIEFFQGPLDLEGSSIYFALTLKEKYIYGTLQFFIPILEFRALLMKVDLEKQLFATANGQRDLKSTQPISQVISQKGGKHWKIEEELEYYSGTIEFFLKNSHYTLSWSQWKPRGFYPFLEKHMSSVFQQKVKSGKQIKTKDQNLKKKHSSKAGEDKDLLSLSYEKIFQFVQSGKKILDTACSHDPNFEKRLKRFSHLITKCEEYNESLLNTKDYEKAILALIDYSQSSNFQRKMRVLKKELTNLSTLSTDESQQDRSPLCKLTQWQ